MVIVVVVVLLINVVLYFDLWILGLIYLIWNVEDSRRNKEKVSIVSGILVWILNWWM